MGIPWTGERSGKRSAAGAGRRLAQPRRRAMDGRSEHQEDSPVNPGIAVIVGLGNPGPEYAETRHNAGFRFLGAVTRREAVSLHAETRFGAAAARAHLAGRDVWLLQPLTFMNHSGDAVSRFAHYYKIPSAQLLVAYDELDLPPGIVRLRQGGGDAGHNGVHDIIEKLGSPDFMRLRIGIGRPPSAGQGASYVLKRAPRAEQALIDAAIELACQHLSDIVQGQYQKAMNALHTHAP
jgi:peptidyl-tRNA hydrolase, PTH1 family